MPLKELRAGSEIRFSKADFTPFTYTPLYSSDTLPVLYVPLVGRMGFEARAIYSPLREMASWTRAWQLVRSCDSYSLLRRALEEAACGDVRNDTDLGNVRAELLMREEEADNAPACFKRDQTILEEWRAMRTRISG